jgi:hypothetical protein
MMRHNFRNRTARDSQRRLPRTPSLRAAASERAQRRCNTMIPAMDGG